MRIGGREKGRGGAEGDKEREAEGENGRMGEKEEKGWI